MNPHIADLHKYPFERLAELLKEETPPTDLSPISLTIGEPRHPPPPQVLEVLANALHGLGSYPNSAGLPALREAAATWATRRFALTPGSLNPDTSVLPVTGTREALFAFGQAVLDGAPDALVAMPNPFYQIYEGTTILAGAQPYYLNCEEASGFQPDLARVPESVWQRCQLLFLCTPGNPTGAVMDLEALKHAIALADRYDFVVASDECYSELYLDEKAPPPGLLQACHALGREDFARCAVFHSLSKRSNLPGMRSGFVAGDARIMAQFRQYRTYHGCAAPLPLQQASVAAWEDEAHVQQNRALYAQKFDTAMRILDGVLDVTRPPAGFYLWPRLDIDGETFARKLYAQQNVSVLPGAFLSRGGGSGDQVNPGQHRVRISLVATVDECEQAMQRIARFVKSQ